MEDVTEVAATETPVEQAPLAPAAEAQAEVKQEAKPEVKPEAKTEAKAGAVDPRDRRAVIAAAVEKAKASAVATNSAGRKIEPSTGKYVPVTPKAATAPVATQPAAAVSPAAPVAQAAQPAAASAQMNVPGSLKAHMKARWAELPQEWREEIARLDKTGAEMGQKFQPQINAYKEIQSVIAPFENLLRATGRTPTQTIAQMLQAEATMLTGTPQQKAQMFRQFAQQYQVPLELITGQPGQAAQYADGAQQPQFQMPDISAHPSFQQLTGTVSQLQQYLTQQQQAQQRTQEEQALKSVQAFLAETKSNGNPKHPLDESLEDAFAAEIGLVRQVHPEWDGRRVLDAAYENLSWKTPTLRDLRLKDQQAEAQARLQQELAAKKVAAVQVKGAPSASGMSAKIDPKDRRAVIEAAFRAKAGG